MTKHSLFRERVPIIKKIEHTAIIVKNIDESIAFYTDMFGMKLRTKGSNGKRILAFVYFEEHPESEIELIQDIDGEQTDYSPTGIVNHLAFTVEDIEAAIEHFKTKGLSFKAEAPGTSIDGAKIIFFEGPNGELLQLVQPTRSLQ